MTRIKDKSKIIKETILKQISEHGEYPYLYSVIEFGFYDNYGLPLPPSHTRKYWDRYEVEKTCVLIRNLLKETFGITGVWFFMERHEPTRDQFGDEISKGRFHLNIVATGIEDDAIENPNRKCRRLWMSEGRMGVPIENLVYNDLDQLKLELFDACCRQTKWVNRYKYSIKTQWIEEPQDLENVVFYSLKDYEENGKTDFTDIVVFNASDFYKP